MLLKKLAGLAETAQHRIQRRELHAVTGFNHAQASVEILLAAINVLDTGVEAIDAAERQGDPALALAEEENPVGS